MVQASGIYEHVVCGPSPIGSMLGSITVITVPIYHTVDTRTRRLINRVAWTLKALTLCVSQTEFKNNILFRACNHSAGDAVGGTVCLCYYSRRPENKLPHLRMLAHLSVGPRFFVFFFCRSEAWAVTVPE